MDSSRNLQANYVIRFLFRLDLVLHACKILIRCDRFGILNFATKQGLGRKVYMEQLYKKERSGSAGVAGS